MEWAGWWQDSHSHPKVESVQIFRACSCVCRVWKLPFFPTTSPIHLAGLSVSVSVAEAVVALL